MALQVRVVHLDDDDAQDAVAVAAQVEAGRIEDVAEDPRIRDQRDPPAGRVLALVAQVVEHRRPQVGRRVRPVIVVAEREEVATVPAEQPRRAIDRVELVEVERQVVHVVLEGVDDRPRPPMADGALEQMRPHAAASRSAVADQRRPRRSPSDSRPRGTRTRGGRPRTRCAMALEPADGGLRVERPERVERVARTTRHDDPLVADPVAGIDRDEVVDRAGQRLEAVHVVGHRHRPAGASHAAWSTFQEDQRRASARHDPLVGVQDDLVAVVVEPVERRRSRRIGVAEQPPRHVGVGRHHDRIEALARASVGPHGDAGVVAQDADHRIAGADGPRPSVAMSRST